jgi:hypothetical protein
MKINGASQMNASSSMGYAAASSDQMGLSRSEI